MMETAIQAVMMVAAVFLSMRVLYGSWPWEGNKTWYATRRLWKAEEPVALSAEQIAHAVASVALATNQLESTESRLKTDSERVDAVIKDLLSDVGSDAKRSETSSERASVAVKELPSNVDSAAEKSSVEGVEEKPIAA